MTTALYRRYRPDTFAEVIGQEHVTEPLMQALRTGKVTHAYLFSGPRGCGKTTSARILARCLNCAQGPTATPCGRCESCVELARGGPGSLDVVEIDAASHGGVDDARDLRERATFAPARDRFKVFILDEAHMVTSQGFNALLKIVEEPPPHVKFVFATTEPDKVIGTIRSRTHHYPFRLVPPDVLTPYLEQVCAAEHVPVGPGVLPLVVRAGGGSVRDSMSVLDQLVAGADENGLDYERAVALLGFTHAALLDDVVDAIAVRDGASAFRVVDRVISSGHEPRRFVEDLLERLRDLIVIAASGEAARAVLRDVPADQYDRMTSQASTLGAAELSRSADLVNDALTEMTGATSPRLHLELLVARLLLPAVDDGARGLAARLEKLERDVVGGVRVGFATPAGGSAAVTASAPLPEPAGARGPSSEVAPAPLRPSDAAPPAGGREAAASPDGGPASPTAPAASVASEGTRGGAGAADDADVVRGDVDGADAVGADTAGGDGPRAPRRGSEPDAPGPRTQGGDEVAEPAEPPAPAPAAARSAENPPDPAAVGPSSASAVAQGSTPAAASTPAGASAAAPGPTAVPVAAPAAGASGAGGLDAETVRRRWPEVLQTLQGLRRATWVLVSQNAHVAELADGRLSLAFTTPQLAGTFRTGNHADPVRRALHETLGLEVRVETTIAGDPTTPAASGSAADRAGGASGSGHAATARPAGAGNDDGRRAISTAEAAASWDAPAPRRAAQTPPSDSAGRAPTAGREPSAGREQRADGGQGTPAAAGAQGPDDSREAGGDAAPGTGRSGPSAGSPAAAGSSIPDDEPPPPWDVPPPEEEPLPDGPVPDPYARSTGRSGPGAPAQPGGSAPRGGQGRSTSGPSAPAPRYDDGEDTDPDDPDIASTGLVGAPLIAQMLGGTVIDEIPEEG